MEIWLKTVQSNERLEHQKILLAAYLVHLTVPLAFLLDELIAWGRGGITFGPRDSDTIVFAVSLLWLAVGLGAFLLCRDRAQFLRRASGPMTSIYVLFLCVLLFELVARVALLRANAMPAVRPPRARFIYEANPAELPGVRGTKIFTVNEIGLRGPSFPDDPHTYKVVTIGGSTTECAVLDDSEEWPHLVMKEMNQREKRYPVWVGNAGISGQNTVHHLVLLQSLPILEKVDLLIFLIGINDLGPALAFEGRPTQIHLEREAEWFRESIVTGGVPHYQFPLYKHLRLFRLIWEANITLARKFRPEGRQQEWMGRGSLANLRRLRAKSKILPLPNLQTGLLEYRGRVTRLAQQCRVLRVRCLFLTQPTLWRSDLLPAEQQLLWWGQIGRWGNQNGYASAADLAKAMNAYNQTLLTECRQNMLECYDLASVVPKNTAAFYDDQHLNEEGAQIVARYVVDYLLSEPPLVEAGGAAGKQRP